MTYSMTNGALKLCISPGARSSFPFRRDIRADQVVWKRLAIVSFIFDYLARALRSRARLASAFLKSGSLWHSKQCAGPSTMCLDGPYFDFRP
jgi:hypothetical protein